MRITPWRPSLEYEHGQGEGGVAPTPGGQSGDAGDPSSLFSTASDLSPSAQGNLAGGNSPAWHGASPDSNGHANAAALSGFKSAEFGGPGYNQLVFDDSDAQQRIQLATTQASTQLNLGHLVHPADNHRGSFRGQGFELRTDAYGSLRGTQGLTLSTYSVDMADPAGDGSAGIALLKQASMLAQSFSSAAQTHHTVALASSLGAQSANQSQLNAQAAPLPALLQTTQGMVTGDSLPTALGDAQNHSTAVSDSTLPHTSDPILSIHARGGLAAIAGQDFHLAAGETATLARGQDSNLAAGTTLHLHSGQAIGLLAGAQKAGDGNSGLTLIAAQGALDLQAQSDALKLVAKNSLQLVSANAQALFAAAKTVTLATAQGASITLDGGNITFTCPGTFTVNASQKAFEGADKLDQQLPKFPTSTLEFDDEVPVSL